MAMGGVWLTRLLLVLASSVGPGDGADGCAELGRLDAQRAAAMSVADVERLRAVYVDRSQAAADVALVQSYAERGLRLHAGSLIQLRCRPVAERADVRRLDVVDRLGPSWVTTRSGERRMLPVDRPDHHVVELRIVDGGWRIARVSAGR